MQTLVLIVITSLKIVFLYEAMKEGMVLSPLRKVLEYLTCKLPKSIREYAQKPLYSCVFCCASVWGFIFTYSETTFIASWAFVWQYLQLLFAIAGLNFLLGMWFGTQRLKRKAIRELLEEVDEPVCEPKAEEIKVTNMGGAIVGVKVHEGSIGYNNNVGMDFGKPDGNFSAELTYHNGKVVNVKILDK